MKVGLLTSGSLGINTLIEIINEFNVVFVLTDSKSEDIISLCKEKNIPFFKGNPRNKLGYNFIKNIQVDVIASINYLFLIDDDIIQHSKQLTFNIHGSLLPKYRGRTPHVWAIINNEIETGITAHVINEKCDAGDIIFQLKVPINKDDTGAVILEKYKLEYYNVFKEVINNLKSNKLALIKQDESLATYFSKRTPDDGRINWNWSKERIRNWIRAQAHPYPGAFFFFEENKIIVNSAEYSNFGFSYMDENGKILKVFNKAVYVKISNGVLKLDDLVYQDFYVELKKGIILK
jgi:methionyl-tRNA formyltransferase